MLPLVAVVLVGLVQVARLGGESLRVISAAREAARAAAVTTDDDKVRRTALASGLEGSRTEVLVDREGGVGAPVTVRVAYRVPAAPPILSWLMPAEITLRADATMRQETG